MHSKPLLLLYYDMLLKFSLGQILECRRQSGERKSERRHLRFSRHA
jgi:hypothetical protein